MLQRKLTKKQINRLTSFVTKHKMVDIEFNKAESVFLFDKIENDENLERARILLQPAFAECYLRNKNDELQVVIIQRDKLLQTQDITWEDGYDDRDQSSNANHFNPFTRKLFEVLIEKIGVDLLLEKIADQLSRNFPLSPGQAKAVIIKYLGFVLDSGTRSFLYDLRKKMRKYQDLLYEFQEYVLENEIPKLIPVYYVNQILRRMDGDNLDSLQQIIPNNWIKIHQEKNSEIDTLVKGRYKISDREGEIEKLEKRFFLQDNPKYEFSCQECNITQEYTSDEAEDEVLEIPFHHDKPMIVRVITK